MRASPLPTLLPTFSRRFALRILAVSALAAVHDAATPTRARADISFVREARARVDLRSRNLIGNPYTWMMGDPRSHGQPDPQRDDIDSWSGAPGPGMPPLFARSFPGQAAELGNPEHVFNRFDGDPEQRERDGITALIAAIAADGATSIASQDGCAPGTVAMAVLLPRPDYDTRDAAYAMVQPAQNTAFTAAGLRVAHAVLPGFSKDKTEWLSSRHSPRMSFLKDMRGLLASLSTPVALMAGLGSIGMRLALLDPPMDLQRDAVYALRAPEGGWWTRSRETHALEVLKDVHGVPVRDIETAALPDAHHRLLFQRPAEGLAVGSAAAVARRMERPSPVAPQSWLGRAVQRRFAGRAPHRPARSARPT